MPRDRRQIDSSPRFGGSIKAVSNFRTLTKFTKSFGVALSPTFRICMALFLSLFYVIQIITHSNASSSWYGDDGSQSYTDSNSAETSAEEAQTNSAFLALDVLLLVVTMLQVRE